MFNLLWVIFNHELVHIELKSVPGCPHNISNSKMCIHPHINKAIITVFTMSFFTIAKRVTVYSL